MPSLPGAERVLLGWLGELGGYISRSLAHALWLPGAPARAVVGCASGSCQKKVPKTFLAL